MAKARLLLLICGISSWVSVAYGTDRGGIASGETRVGLNITAPAYTDTWTFSGAFGDRVVINAVPTSGTLHTDITLYPPGGGPAEASTISEQLDHQLQQTGLYTIVIADFGLDAPGDYNISFLKIPGAVSHLGDRDGGPIASGQTSSGAIDVASDLDAFQFHGQVGDRVVINAVPTSGTLHTDITLYPPGGGPAEASTISEQLDHQLQQTGLYTIVIADFGLDAPGDYNISFLKILGAVSHPGDRDGGAIISGDNFSHAIDVASDLDAFHFYGLTGDRVIINAVATSGTLHTDITLYPPSGGPAEASTISEQLDHQLQQTGLYTIVIADFGLDAPGDYKISLTKIPPTLRPGIYNPQPPDGAILRGAVGSFAWDAVPGATGYDLYFGENVVQPLAEIGNNLPSPTLPIPAVQQGTIYYWHVVAHTPGGDIEGPYWWFTVGAVHVDDSNTTGQEDGTEAHPFNTIQEAIDFVWPGGIIKVAQGTYPENLSISGKLLTAQGGYPGGTYPGTGDFADAHRDPDPSTNSTVIDGPGTPTTIVCQDAAAKGSMLRSFAVRNRATFRGGVVLKGVLVRP